MGSYLVVEARAFTSLSFLKSLHKSCLRSLKVSFGKMFKVIVIITTEKLLTVWLPVKLACWRNLALRSPFSNISILLYMGELVVTFWLTKTFWTKSKKMIHSSGVPKSNIKILITHFPELESFRELWYIWSTYLLVSKFSISGRSLVNQ